MCREPVPNILEGASCVYHTNLPPLPPPLPAANLGLKVKVDSYLNIRKYTYPLIYKLLTHEFLLHESCKFMPVFQFLSIIFVTTKIHLFCLKANYLKKIVLTYH